MSKVQNRIEFFDKHIKNYHLSKDGVNINIWCPFCKNSNKNKRKMVIHLEKCFYHCWVCDKKGSNIGYLISRISSKAAKICDGLFKSHNKKFNLFEELKEEEFKQKILTDIEGNS